MAIKVRLEKPKLKVSWPKFFFSSWLVRGFLALIVLVGIVGFGVFMHYYNKYARIVDDRLQQPLFAETAKIFAAAREVRPGQKLSAHVIATELRDAGYSVDGLSHPSQMGTFTEDSDEITIRPGAQSYHAPDPATIHFKKGEVESVMVQAVLAIEDRRFFEHGGVNYRSMAGWAWHDIIGDRKHRGGASTVTMQLAKLLFVADTGTIKYKITQILVAFHLEHRFTKKQIFEAYANQINIGQRVTRLTDSRILRRWERSRRMATKSRFIPGHSRITPQMLPRFTSEKARFSRFPMTRGSHWPVTSWNPCS
ncbi:MAG: transglycosylase domain-containing protein [Acidobacteriales bacterium]|nr:transglycosylase domain-containing protein [Terriglobales bacterium]